MRKLVVLVIIVLFSAFSSVSAHGGEDENGMPIPAGGTAAGASTKELKVKDCEFTEEGNLIYYNQTGNSDPWLSSQGLYRMSELIRNYTTPKSNYSWLGWRIFTTIEPHNSESPQQYGGYFWSGSWDPETCTLKGGNYDGPERVRIVVIVDYNRDDESFEAATAAHEFSHSWGSPHGASSPESIAADRQSHNFNDAYWWSTESGDWWEVDDSPAARAYTSTCRDLNDETGLVQDPVCHIVYKAVVLGEIYMPDGRLVQTIP
jgi:hypothetical protein